MADQDKANKHGAYRVEHIHRSRDNRKGRHPIRIHYGEPPEKEERKEAMEKYFTPHPTNSLKVFIRTLRTLFTTFPIYDISYAVGLSFVVGSAVWVIYGFF